MKLVLVFKLLSPILSNCLFYELEYQTKFGLEIFINCQERGNKFIKKKIKLKDILWKVFLYFPLNLLLTFKFAFAKIAFNIICCFLFKWLVRAWR